MGDVTHGALDLTSDGGFTYTPTTGYDGPDSFTYKANDGTDDSNTVTVSIGIGNLGLDLGGTSYVTFGDPAKLDFSQFTIETWFKRTGAGTSNTTGGSGITNLVPLLTHGAPQAEGSNVDADWILGISTSGTGTTNVLAADFEEGIGGSSPGLNHPVYGSTVITDNVWHHAAATYDGTTWNLYLDGNLDATLTVGQPVRSDSTQRVALGAMITSTDSAVGRFDGILDEARVWNVARSGSAILADKNVELTAGTGLAARWGLNEAPGTIVHDSLASPADGTITGTGFARVAGFVPPVSGNNAPDAPTLNSPADGGTGIGTSPTLGVHVSDPDDDTLTVTYYGRPYASGNFSQIGAPAVIASGEDNTINWPSLGAGQTFEWYATVSDSSLTTTSPTWTFHTTPSTDPVFVGAGDIADCSRTQDEATGAVIGAIDGTVWTAGDNVYPSGSVTSNWDCYETGWGGSIKSRTHPVPGNHDWGTGQGGAVNLDAYFAYFGANANAGGTSYYSYNIPASNWHVVNLDSECAQVAGGGCGAGSAQELWLKADLAANSTKNVIAIWHKPRYSSGVTNLQDLQPFWDDLYAAGVDILLDGHDHIYERLSPIKSGATLGSQPVADPTYGIQQFTVGTGGASLQSCPGTRLTASQTCNSSTYGVLKLTLHPSSYDWTFLPMAGQTFTDSGSGSVHGAPSSGNNAPVATADAYSTFENATLDIAAPGVLTNDTDSDSDPLTAILDTDVSHGALTLQADGGFTYLPSTDYTGGDSFTYHANDGIDDSSIVTVSLSVEPSETDAALEFNGSTQYVTFGAAPSLGATSFTLESWFKWTGAGVTASTGTGGVVAIPLVTKGLHESDGSNLDANYFLGITTGGNLAADFEDAASGANHPVTGDAVVTTDVWHHAAVAYDATTGTWKLYLDGALDKTLVLASAFQPRSDSIQHAGIGTAMNSSGTVEGFFAGVIDETRIWNVTRTGGEIAGARDQELLSGTGLIGRWGMSENTGTALGNSVAAGVDGTSTAFPDWVTPGFIPPGSSGNNAPVATADAYYTPQDTDLVVAAPGVLGNDTDADTDPLTAVLVGDVTHGALDLTSDGGFTYTPTTGYDGPDSFTYKANDGTDDSNTVTVSIGIGNLGLDLGGTSYVTFGDPAKLDLSQFTIETWFKRTGAGTSNTTGGSGITNLVPLLTHGAPQAEGSNVDADWILGISTSGTGTTNVLAADFEEGIGGSSPGLNHPVYGSTVITDNVWHHAAATYDGTTWNLYLDGNLDATLTVGQPVRSDSTQRVALGAMITSTDSAVGRFDGILDEARVWNVARSGSAILADKNVELTAGTGLAARWGLNEAPGTIVHDSLASPADGTITGTGFARVAGFVPPVSGNNAPDAPTLNSPADGGTGIGTSPTLGVHVSDPDDDTLTVTYYGRPYASGNFSQIGAPAVIPSGSDNTINWPSLGAGQTFEWYATVSDSSLTTTSPTWTFHTTPSTDPVFVGVGDIGSCDVTTDTDAGNVVKGIDGTVFTTGDNVYPNGAVDDFANCLAPTPWGDTDVLSRTHPVPGNHDWGTGVTDNLDGYFDFYGANANAGGTSYYSYNIPASNWHVVNLDSECAQVAGGGCGAGSAQELWLKADLAANSTKNVIALWHKPRYSSGATNLQALQPFWDDLYAAGVDILLDGHDHIYERFSPMKSGATLGSQPVADPTYGIHQFTVGMGGQAHHNLGTTLGTSVVRNNTDFGIFKLTLHPTSYDYVFLPIAGSTFTDSGTGTVHGAPAAGSDPIVHWTMDETTGPVAHDTGAAPANDASAIGSPTWVTGQDGNAWHFDGASQYATTADSNDLDLTSAITIAAWVKPEMVGSSNVPQQVIQKATTGSTNGYEIGLTGATSTAPQKAFIRFNKSSSGDTYRATSTAVYPTDGNTWIHIAGTWDGSTIRLYYDGVLQGSVPFAGPIATNTLAIGVGGPPILDTSRISRAPSTMPGSTTARSRGARSPRSQRSPATTPRMRRPSTARPTVVPGSAPRRPSVSMSATPTTTR